MLFHCCFQTLFDGYVIYSHYSEGNRTSSEYDLYATFHSKSFNIKVEFLDKIFFRFFEAKVLSKKFFLERAMFTYNIYFVLFTILNFFMGSQADY